MTSWMALNFFYLSLFAYLFVLVSKTFSWLYHPTHIKIFILAIPLFQELFFSDFLFLFENCI